MKKREAEGVQLKAPKATGPGLLTGLCSRVSQRSPAQPRGAHGHHPTGLRAQAPWDRETATLQGQPGMVDNRPAARGDEGARASVGRTQVNTGWGGEVTRAVPAPDGALEGSRAGSAGGPAAAQCKCPPPSSALASQSYPLRAEPLSPVCSHSRQVMLGARKPNATAPSLPSAKALGSATGLDGCPLFSPWLGQETSSGL